MPRPEKVQAVADIKQRFEEANAVFLAEYAGLSVKQQQALRRGLRAQEAELKVVKMTLARRATESLALDELQALLIGPTALAFAEGDTVAAAKVLRDFAKENPSLVIKGGFLAGEIIAPERVSQLADIEPRDVLLAKLAGGFQAPMARTAGLLGALLRNTASVMQQLIDRRVAGGEMAPPVAGAEPAPEAEGVEPEAAAEPAPEAEGAEPEAAAEPAPEAEAEAGLAEAEEADAEPAAEAEAEAVTEADAAPGGEHEPAADSAPVATTDSETEETETPDDDPAVKAEED